jgi:peptidoglycan/LPS O-acetylase OafA/YrhL
LVAEFWGQDITPALNSPFWSLSYEIAFYFVYGLFLATAGWWRVAVLALSCLAVGPNIVMLMSCWLLGVGVHAIVHNINSKNLLFTLSILPGSFVGYGLLFQWDALKELQVFFSDMSPTFYATIDVLPGRADKGYIFNATLFAGLFLSLITFSKLLDSDSSFMPPRKIMIYSRKVGNFTFPLYLFHFPLFVLIASVGLYNRDSAWQMHLWFAIVCIVIFIVTPFTDKLRGWMKKLFKTSR